LKKLSRILIPLMVALVAIFSFGGAALAAGPTDVTVDWNGAGWVGGGVDTGDASVSFQSGGSGANMGAFTAHDSNDNPYSYNVDSCSFSLDTGISGSGFAELMVNRLTSASSYGAAGQLSYIGVGIADGSATLQNRSATNYASMRDGNYGWNANDHITVTGASGYDLQRYVDSGTGNFAGIRVDGGVGDADLDCMSSEASAGQVRLGWGCGCYTNADFNANGSGTMTLAGAGNNSATTAMAPGMTGASSFNFVANWVNSAFGLANYSTTAN